MTKDEALKLAMEAMEITGGFDVEINAIKEALMSGTDGAQPEQEPRYGYKGKCNRVMSDGNPCGLNAPCPDCGLSLIDCPKPQPWEKFCDSNCVWTDHHPDCKLAEQEPVDITNHVSDEDEETCPNCGKPLQSKRGGGVVCSARCGYWFCF